MNPTASEDTSDLSDLIGQAASSLTDEDFVESARNKKIVSEMYSDHGDTAVQQNMIVDNLEPDMY